MAHLAVSDPVGDRYRFDEKLTRGGPGLSGAATDRYTVWNEDWTAGLDAQGRHVHLGAERHRPASSSCSARARRPVINGVDGISQKGAQAGNASHYYSLTRMPTRGTITVDGERFEVTGRQLDGPRVRHQLPRARTAGLGLAVAAARRRPRADALPAAPRRRHARSAIERHAGGRAGPRHPSRDERLHAGAGGPDVQGALGRRLPDQLDDHGAGAAARARRLHAAAESGTGHARAPASPTGRAWWTWPARLAVPAFRAGATSR